MSSVSGKDIQFLTEQIKQVFDQLITKNLESHVHIERDLMTANFKVYVNFSYKVSMMEIARNGANKAFLENTIKTAEEISNNIKDLEK